MENANLFFTYLRLLATLLLSGLLLFSCQKEQSTFSDNSPSAISAELRDLLTKSGFDVTDAKQIGNDVVVEGDIWLGLEHIQALKNNPGPHLRGPGDTLADERQYAANYGMLLNQANTSLTFYFDPSVPQDWKTAFLAGRTSWNGAGPNNTCNVFWFETNSSSANVVIAMKGSATLNNSGDPIFTDIPANWDGIIAKTKIPTGGVACHYIGVNGGYNYLSAANKQKVATHEMGHTIGLKHDNGANGGVFMLGTPQVDGTASIMNAFPTNNPSASLSPWDGVAAIMMYPKNGYAKPSYLNVQEQSGGNVRFTMAYPTTSAGNKLRPAFVQAYRWNATNGQYEGYVYLGIDKDNYSPGQVKTPWFTRGTGPKIFALRWYNWDGTIYSAQSNFITVP